MHPGAHRIIVMRVIGVYMSDKVLVGTPQHCDELQYFSGAWFIYEG